MSYWLVNIFGFGMAAFFIWLINRAVRDPWNYVNIFSFFYAGALVGSQLWFGLILESEYKPNEETLIIFFLSWWAFLCGSVFVINGLTPISSVTRLKYIKKNNSIIVLFFLIVANFIYNIAAMYSNGSFDALMHLDLSFLDSLAMNRIMNSGDLSKGDVGWYLELWHTAYLYYVPLSLYMYRMRYISRRAVVAVSIYGLISSLILFSRIHLLMLLVVMFVTWIALFRPSYKVVLFKVAMVLFAAFLLFVGMQASLSKNEIHKSEATLVEGVMTYAFSPIPSYQEMLNGKYEEDNPHEALYTLQSMYYFAGKLGFLNATEYPISYREYVFAPYPTNVYTFLDAFTLDFGSVGAVIGSLFLGVFVAIIYRRLRVSVGYFTLLIYALSVYSCSVAMLTNMFIQHVFVLQIVTVWLIHISLMVTVSPKNYTLRDTRDPLHSGVKRTL